MNHLSMEFYQVLSSDFDGISTAGLYYSVH